MLLCGERNQNYFWSYGFLGFNLKQKTTASPLNGLCSREGQTAVVLERHLPQNHLNAAKGLAWPQTRPIGCSQTACRVVPAKASRHVHYFCPFKPQAVL